MTQSWQFYVRQRQQLNAVMSPNKPSQRQRTPLSLAKPDPSVGHNGREPSDQFSRISFWDLRNNKGEDTGVVKESCIHPTKMNSKSNFTRQVLWELTAKGLFLIIIIIIIL